MAGYLGPKAIQYNVENSVVQGDSSIGGDLTVEGKVTSASLETTDGATIGGDLTVDGTITSTGKVTSSSLETTDGATLGGNLTVDGTITSTGKVTSSSLTTTAGAAVGGNLAVTGSTTSTGTVTAKGTLSVSGTTNAKRINGVGIFSVKSNAGENQIYAQDSGYTRLYNKGSSCLETTSYGVLVKKLKIGARNTTSSYVLWRDEASTDTEFNGGITHSTYGAYGSFYPCKSGGAGKDKKINWGSDTNPWKTFYASVGTINTSDKTFKQDIEDISEAEHCVARRLRRKFKTYRWQQSVGRKGDDARTYTGLMAQDVEQCFRDEGLDPAKYAMWHRTEYKQTSTTNADGTVETTNYDLGDENTPDDAVDKVTYGLNYVEILCFILSAEAADREKLTDRLSTLEGRLVALEDKDEAKTLEIQEETP